MQFETTLRAAGRPFGPRFGTLTHAILRDSELRAERVEALAAMHGRSAGATRDEISAAAEAAKAALAHPLIARARAAERILIETPLMARIDGRALDGTMDLAFLENGVWHIIDFKTDAHIETRRKHYETQLGWYAVALSRATGRAVECHLLAV